MTSRASTPRIGDAFGHALLDALEGGQGWHVVERDDGLVEPMAGVDYFAQPTAWDELDRGAVDLVSGCVLDVGAGAGRHALELQSRGHEVVALDVSSGALDVCATRGVEHTFLGTVPELVEIQPKRFDAILMMGHNMALLGSQVSSWRLFEAMRRLLVPGGIVVGTCTNPYMTDDPDHLAYQRSNIDRGRMGGQLAIRVRFRRLATDWFDYLIMAPNELRDLAQVAGWEIVDVSEPNPSYLAVMRPA